MSTSELEAIIPNENQVTGVPGLGIVTASIFLAGEMAGSGVLALPSAIVLTGNKELLIAGLPVSYDLS